VEELRRWAVFENCGTKMQAWNERLVISNQLRRNIYHKEIYFSGWLLIASRLQHPLTAAAVVRNEHISKLKLGRKPYFLR
jgi:hypothetical protein